MQTVRWRISHIYTSLQRICWQDNFDLQTDTYNSYAKRNHWGRKLLFKVFQGEKSTLKPKKHLNYEIS